jgi:hypothetical protein
MTTSLLILGGIVLLVAGILLEGKRQERKYGKARGTSLMRAGMLDLQRHLEPERKIEILLDQPEDDAASRSGDPPKPGER